MGFLVRRFLFYLAAFLVAITVNFALPRLMPGDPFEIMFAAAQGKITPEQLPALKAQYGFVEGPWYVQYGAYLKSVFTWDLGPSVLFFPTPVSEVIGYALPWTLFISGSATLISILIGSLMGIYAAYHQGGWFDKLASPTFLVLGAFPAVVMAMILFYIFGLVLEWFPISYGYDPDLDPGWNLTFIGNVLYHAILPILSMVLISIGGWLFHMRNSMIHLLSEDYIRMAVGKGLSRRRVMFQYAARNAILPVITAVSMAIAFIVGGAIFVEIVFNYPGLGNLMLKGVMVRDYPLIQALMLIIVICVLVANFVADLLYLWLDPRLRQ
ncbi:MAG: ABC transporter permease [Gemmatimonadetes bacterium]|nr:MAG: ABC transporter permease [Gemmatimonadota bacterium]